MSVDVHGRGKTVSASCVRAPISVLILLLVSAPDTLDANVLAEVVLLAEEDGVDEAKLVGV